MYTLLSALAIGKTLQGSWGAIPNTTLVSTARDNYRKVILTVSTTNSTVNFDAADFPAWSTFTGDLAAYVTSLGSLPLTAIIDLPSNDSRHVAYGDAYMAGYSVQVGNFNYGPGVSVPESLAKDVVLTRSNPPTLMSEVASYCVCTVNGFMHQLHADGSNRAFAVDAAKSMKVSNANQIGLINFSKVGKVKTIQITQDKLEPFTPFPLYGKLIDGMYINADESLVGKTVLLVVGGYLILPGPQLKNIGNDTVQFTPDKALLLGRYFDGADYLNLQALELPSVPTNPDLVDPDTFFSNAVLTKYMTLSQSFLLVIDTPELIYSQVSVFNDGLPDEWYTKDQPTLPLFVSRGRCLPYLAIEGDDRWVMKTNNSRHHYYLFETVPVSAYSTIDDRVVMLEPYNYKNAFMLDISTTK